MNLSQTEYAEKRLRFPFLKLIEECANEVVNYQRFR